MPAPDPSHEPLFARLVAVVARLRGWGPVNGADRTWRAVRQLAYWTVLAVPVGLLGGSASAFFLWALDRVTELRWHHGWLLYLLPVVGVGVGWLYHRFGKGADGGNNLIIEQIHEPGGGVPRRMAPLVLLGTLATHLCGGSAGREGTAVQMGGSLAAAYGRLLGIGREQMPVLLMAGVAAGFGSVFGTPFTGAVFAMEVLAIGRLDYRALLPVLAASVTADATCAAWGADHTRYHILFTSGRSGPEVLDGWLAVKVVLAAGVFGLAARGFSELTHGLQRGLRRLVTRTWLQPAVGGAAVIALFWLAGTGEYLGLGVHGQHPGAVTILSAFEPGGATAWSWLWKLVFTAVTIAAGFKGGEVTPLFFIGATLGHALASALGAPVDLFAGLGFIAVFAGATNTPLACTIMGIELFGAQHTVFFAVACFVAYFASGHTGIYGAQRIAVSKHGAGQESGATLRQVRERRNAE